MIAPLVLTAVLLITPASPPDPVVATPVRPASQSADSGTSGDRELALNRPSRSGRTTVRVLLAASTVPRPLRAFAACVLDRESGGTLERVQSGAGARNPASSAQGRWQMLDGSGWRHGGSWLVYKRLRAFGLPKAQARKVQRFLAARPIYRWNGYWQDIAFIQSISEGGWRHWQGHTCGRP